MSKKIFPLILICILSSCGGNILEPKSGIPNEIPNEEKDVFAEVNAVRATGHYCGPKYYPAAPVLTWNDQLAASAKAHSSDMATNRFFDHVSPSGSTIKSRAEAASYTGWTALGENIAAGSTVIGVTQDWLGSEGHCQNIMNPLYKEMGMGYVYMLGSQYGTYWTQDFGTR